MDAADKCRSGGDIMLTSERLLVRCGLFAMTQVFLGQRLVSYELIQPESRRAPLQLLGARTSSANLRFGFGDQP